MSERYVIIVADGIAEKHGGFADRDEAVRYLDAYDFGPSAYVTRVEAGFVVQGINVHTHTRQWYAPQDRRGESRRSDARKASFYVSGVQAARSRARAEHLHHHHDRDWRVVPATRYWAPNGGVVVLVHDCDHVEWQSLDAPKSE